MSAEDSLDPRHHLLDPDSVLLRGMLAANVAVVLGPLHELDDLRHDLVLNVLVDERVQPRQGHIE
eukprot:CAMPEP_0204195192 /NCGR_PEP_ID=MMETSP0361-20130328/62907_1 /ASSEMBLY_ACC=CAM_ASM_000343 /TAXON_ID=268821 /ORGANISM="Scrippsiella Hangoei, Strain SHTV-5" /LENGTH=64 /DNA_ID=CAMNT_0051156711 /DNA_START=74 /DNA_END=265 /DNA_ORIENTATION=+